MINNKSTLYHLNGKEVDKATLKARKDATLYDVQVIVHRYYKAPLNEAELAERHIDAVNSMKFFRERQEMREDQEKYHG